MGTIVLGLHSENHALVASDGRLFAPGEFDPETGVVKKEAEVKTDAFDKTFSLLDGTVVGAYAGTMAFDGKIVAEHLKELSSRIPGQSILPAFADHLFDIFVERSGNISDVAPEWQRFDIMLIGRYCMDSGKFSVWTLHHFPRDPSLKHHNVRTSFHDYAVAGDTPAKDGALDALKAKHRSIPNMDRSNLQALAHRAIKEGIRKCGPHELCPAAKTAACGGRLFVRFCAR